MAYSKNLPDKDNKALLNKASKTKVRKSSRSIRPTLGEISQKQRESLQDATRLNQANDENEKIDWLNVVDPIKLLNPVAPAYIALEYTKASLGGWIDTTLGKTNFSSEDFFESNKDYFRFGLKALLQAVFLPFEAIALAGVRIPNLIIDTGRNLASKFYNSGFFSSSHSIVANRISNLLSQAKEAWSEKKQTADTEPLMKPEEKHEEQQRQSSKSEVSKDKVSEQLNTENDPQKPVLPRTPAASAPGERGYPTGHSSKHNPTASQDTTARPNSN